MEEERSPMKILLVEDDEDDYIIARDLFDDIEGAKFELDWAATFDAGMRAICQREHDVYFVDYRLGERSGLELIHEVISMGCEAPLILLTGQGGREVDMEAMKAGALDYLWRMNASSRRPKSMQRLPHRIPTERSLRS